MDSKAVFASNGEFGEVFLEREIFELECEGWWICKHRNGARKMLKDRASYQGRKLSMSEKKFCRICGGEYRETDKMDRLK